MAHPTHPGMTIDQLQARLVELGHTVRNAVEEQHQICEELMDRIENQIAKTHGLRVVLDAADDALDKETYEQKRKDNFDPPLDAEYSVTVGTIQKINAVFQALDAALK